MSTHFEHDARRIGPSGAGPNGKRWPPSPASAVPTTIDALATRSRELRVLRSWLIPLVMAVPASMVVASAFAAGWNVKNVVRQEFQIDDNIRLLTDNAEPVAGFVSTPEAEISNKSPNLDIEAAVILDINRFFGTGTSEEGAKERNSFDQNARAHMEYRLERITLGVDGRYNRETARTSEVTDTGRIESDATREHFSLAGQVSYLASERDTVQASGSYADSTYDTDEFTDFTSIGVAATWSRQLLPEDRIELIANGSRFETKTGSEFESDFVSLEGQWLHAFSQRLNVRMGAGGRYVASEFNEVQGGSTVRTSRSSFGSVANLRTNFQATPNTGFELAFERSVDPSGSGESRENDRLDLTVRHRISPAWSTDLSGLAIRQGAADGDTVNERRYFSVSARLRWNFVRHLFLTAAYRFRMQEFENGGDGAISNAVIFSVVYDPPVW